MSDFQFYDTSKGRKSKPTFGKRDYTKKLRLVERNKATLLRVELPNNAKILKVFQSISRKKCWKALEFVASEGHCDI